MDIFLASDYFDLSEPQVNVEGELFFLDSNGFAEGMLQIRLCGEETFHDGYCTKTTNILDLSLESLVYASRDSSFSFSFPLTKDLPPTLVHPAASVTYTLQSTFHPLFSSNAGCSVQRPVYLTRSKIPITTIIWGTTQEKIWKYEVEVPKIISLNQECWITIRLQQMRKRSRAVEAMPQSLLVGTQVWELTTLETPTTNQTSLTQCIDPVTYIHQGHPSTTWMQPISFPIVLEASRANQEMHSEHIHIKHNLHLTIAFGTSGESDIVLDFPVTVSCGVVAMDEAITTASLRESSDIGPEKLIRRDSGVDITAPSFDFSNKEGIQYMGHGALYDQAHVCGTLKIKSLTKPALLRRESIMTLRDRMTK